MYEVVFTVTIVSLKIFINSLEKFDNKRLFFDSKESQMSDKDFF